MTLTFGDGTPGPSTCACGVKSKPVTTVQQLKEEIADSNTKELSACVIPGVGKDAEVYTNAAGGKQSKSPASLHLLDPMFLHYGIQKVDNVGVNVDAITAVDYIAIYMSACTDNTALYLALDSLEHDKLQQFLIIGRILQYGATKGNNGKGYPVNNWRLIPREEHINHALIHLIAWLMGDTQDDHREHAMCRIHMALATSETPGFYYDKPTTIGCKLQYQGFSNKTFDTSNIMLGTPE